MSTFFCGNPFNHGPHDTDLGQCAGVGRQEVKDEEVVVEEYKPVVYPDPPKAELKNNDDFMRGWRDGHNLTAYSYSRSNPEPFDYVTGYESALRWKIDNAKIEPNEARKLLGLPPFDPETVGKEWDNKVRGNIPFDPVKIPEHYNTGKIEVTNFISDQGLNFARGNVVKYVARAGKKDPDKELQDLEKAAAYLQMAYNLAQGKPAVVRDPDTNEVVWTLFKN